MRNEAAVPAEARGGADSRGRGARPPPPHECVWRPRAKPSGASAGEVVAPDGPAASALPRGPRLAAGPGADRRRRGRQLLPGGPHGQAAQHGGAQAARRGGLCTEQPQAEHGQPGPDLSQGRCAQRRGVGAGGGCLLTRPVRFHWGSSYRGGAGRSPGPEQRERGGGGPGRDLPRAGGRRAHAGVQRRDCGHLPKGCLVPAVHAVSGVYGRPRVLAHQRGGCAKGGRVRHVHGQRGQARRQPAPGRGGRPCPWLAPRADRPRPDAAPRAGHQPRVLRLEQRAARPAARPPHPAPRPCLDPRARRGPGRQHAAVGAWHPRALPPQLPHRRQASAALRQGGPHASRRRLLLLPAQLRVPVPA
mmetsp:Transcript_11647/g.45305  ORF Transcript_11647/g.45305 Transcript_11647/m.45305 type:complete len:360 (-) Transcript_11647:974-2053(-)